MVILQSILVLLLFLGCNDYKTVQEENILNCHSLNEEQCKKFDECKVLETGDLKSYGSGKNFYIYDNKNFCSNFNSSPIFIGCLNRDEDIFENLWFEDNLSIFKKEDRYIATDLNISKENLFDWKFDINTTIKFKNHFKDISEEEKYFVYEIYPKYCGWSGVIQNCYSLNREECRNSQFCKEIETTSYTKFIASEVSYYTFNSEKLCLDFNQTTFIGCINQTDYIEFGIRFYNRPSLYDIKLFKNANRYIASQSVNMDIVDREGNSSKLFDLFPSWKVDLNQTRETLSFYEMLPENDRFYVLNNDTFPLKAIDKELEEVKFFGENPYIEQLPENLKNSFSYTQFIRFCDWNKSVTSKTYTKDLK
jgi:hypothetical protein